MQHDEINEFARQIQLALDKILNDEELDRNKVINLRKQVRPIVTDPCAKEKFKIYAQKFVDKINTDL